MLSSSADTYTALITATTSQLAPTNSASNLTKSWRGRRVMLSSLLKHTGRQRCSPKVRQGAHASARSPARISQGPCLLAGAAVRELGCCSGRATRLRTRAMCSACSDELFPAAPRLPPPSDERGERVMGTLHTLQRPEEAGRASRGRRFCSFCFVFFLSILCRKEDWREDRGDLKNYTSLSWCMKTLSICSLLLQLGTEAEFAAGRAGPLPNFREKNSPTAHPAVTR